MSGKLLKRVPILKSPVWTKQGTAGSNLLSPTLQVNTFPPCVQTDLHKAKIWIPMRHQLLDHPWPVQDMFTAVLISFYSSIAYRLLGLVVRRLPWERMVLGSNPTCAGIFPGSSHTSDLNIGTPVATLPGAWRYRVSAGTGRPNVSILWLGEVESWICNFYLSVAAHKIVCADLSLRYTSMLLGR